MTETPASGQPRAAFLLGAVVSFVAAIDLIRLVGPDLLTDPEPSWALPRLVLAFFVLTVATAAGVCAAGGFFLWGRMQPTGCHLEPVELGRKTLVLVAAAALGFGILVRFAWLDQLPATIWIDEILPLRPALELKGSVADFADAIRILPTSHVFIGVLYLEGFRVILNAFGPTLLAIRLPGALAGGLSLVTAMLLGRALLPRGGGTLAGLILAGLRWQVILARFGWNALALAPIVDIAALLLIRARRRSSLPAAAAGGLVAGVGAHVYLGSWIAAAALGGFLLWPQVSRASLIRRCALALVFGLGFLAAASPIFLLRKNREASYFARASDQSLLKDMKRPNPWMVPLSIVADSFEAPWFLPDPVPRQDLPQSRLGWIIGVPFAVGLLGALRCPREDLSALIFPHAAAAVAASLRWGLPGHPNGFRFLYLTTLAAVVAAAGVLRLLGLVSGPKRRAATLAAVGLLAAGALLGARDALFRWCESRETFDAYWSDATLVGRSALRWERYGQVAVSEHLPCVPFVVEVVRAYRLDTDPFVSGDPLSRGRAPRCFRIDVPKAEPREGERRVEEIRDGWGRDWGVVFAGRCPSPRPSGDGERGG